MSLSLCLSLCVSLSVSLSVFLCMCMCESVYLSLSFSLVVVLLAFLVRIASVLHGDKSPGDARNASKASDNRGLVSVLTDLRRK